MSLETERAEMPKKIIVLILAAAAALMTTAAGRAAAQERPDRSPVRFYVNLGYVNLFSYPKWIALGPEFELRLCRLISVNPDVSIWIGQSFGRKVRVVPGGTVNLRLGRFVIGGGAVGRVPEWAGSGTGTGERAAGWLVPKAQIGYMAGPTRLTLSLYYLSGSKDVVAAATIGIGIGLRSRD
jgi:hypothetical protein